MIGPIGIHLLQIFIAQIVSTKAFRSLVPYQFCSWARYPKADFALCIVEPMNQMVLCFLGDSTNSSNARLVVVYDVRNRRAGCWNGQLIIKRYSASPNGSHVPYQIVNSLRREALPIYVVAAEFFHRCCSTFLLANQVVSNL